MKDLTDPKLAELENMKTEIVRMLRTSRLDELEKKNLMFLLPYLPLSRVKPIFEKLKDEADIRSGRKKLSGEQAKRVLKKIKKIEREVWKKAEEGSKPSEKKLDQKLTQELSQV